MVPPFDGGATQQMLHWDSVEIHELSFVLIGAFLNTQISTLKHSD